MKKKTPVNRKPANEDSPPEKTAEAPCMPGEWPLTGDVRRAIVNRQVRVAIDPEVSNREATSAARCLAALNSQNLRGDAQQAAPCAPHLTSVTRQELLNDPEYLDWLRSRAVDDETENRSDDPLDDEPGRGDVDAGTVRQDSQPGTVEAGRASPRSGPGDYGHARGS